MRSRTLVIDVNILIQAALDVRVRRLIERYRDAVACYVAEPNYDEAAKIVAEFAAKRGIR